MKHFYQQYKKGVSVLYTEIWVTDLVNDSVNQQLTRSINKIDQSNLVNIISKISSERVYSLPSQGATNWAILHHCKTFSICLSYNTLMISFVNFPLLNFFVLTFNIFLVWKVTFKNKVNFHLKHFIIRLDLPWRSG